MYCPTTEVLKPGAKTRWGFSQEICCERPPEIQWKAAPWNRGIAESPSKSWGYHGIYWEYHSATLGSKDVPNISPIHVFTHLHVFFLIVQWFTRFWNDAPCFFMDAPSPTFAVTQWCLQSQSLRTSGHQRFAPKSVGCMKCTSDGSRWCLLDTYIVTPKNMDRWFQDGMDYVWIYLSHIFPVSKCSVFWRLL